MQTIDVEIAASGFPPASLSPKPSVDVSPWSTPVYAEARASGAFGVVEPAGLADGWRTVSA